MTAGRPRFPTKAAWAAAKAADLRQQARSRPYAPAANWRAVQRTAAGRSHLDREALRYERLAARFKALGV